jgi:hypothetical protein
MAFSPVTGNIAGTVNVGANVTFSSSNTGNNTTVTGTISNNGGTVNGAASTLNFASGSIYRLNHTTSSGGCPLATWHTNSTVNIVGYTTATSLTSGFSQTFGNVTWNCPNQTSNLSLSGSSPTILGTFTITSTGSGTLRYSANAAGTLTVNNFLLSGGTFNLSSGSANSTLKVTGSFTQNNGTTLTISGSGTTNFVEFIGSAAQDVSLNGTITGRVNFRINNANNINLTGTMPLNTSATLDIKAGTISGGTITYSGTNTLSYTGSTAYTATTKEFPNTTNIANLIVNNSAGITLPFSRTVTNLTLTSGNVTLSNANDVLTVASNPTRTNGHIVGKMARTYNGTSSSVAFEIGDATTYGRVSLATVNASNVTITARVVSGTPTGTSAIGAFKNNRYWEIIVTGGTLNSIANASFSQSVVINDKIVNASSENGNYTAVSSAQSFNAATITSSSNSISNVLGYFAIVNCAPAITTQPVAQNVCPNANASFSVSAVGEGLNYQWRKGGNNIIGATSATYNVSNATISEVSNYDCVITGTCSSVTSNAVALSLININNAPTLTAIPNQMVNAGESSDVNLIGINAGDIAQDITITATSNNLSVLPNPTITYTSPNATGTLTLNPIANKSGIATVTVTVTDNGGTLCGGVNTFSRTFTVSVANNGIVCAEPTNLNVVSTANSSASLSWTASSSPSNQLYVLQFKRPASLTWNTRTYSPTTTSATITGLASNTQYEWRLKAVCKQTIPVVESSWVTGANFTTTGTCDAPSGLTASNPTNTSVALSWTTATGAQLQVLQFKPSDQITWTTRTFAPSVSGIVLTGLIPNVTYNWRIKAVCDQVAPAIESVFANGTDFTTTGSCLVPNVTGTTPALNSATLFWEGVSGAELFVVQWKSATASTWNTRTFAPNVTSATISNLACSQNYVWRIKTVCRQTAPVIESAYTSETAFTTLTCAGREDMTPLSMTFYPNPTTSNAKLNILVNGMEEEGQVLIYNALGSIIHTQKLQNGTAEVALSNASAGIYFVRLNANGQSLVKKLIIE